MSESRSWWTTHQFRNRGGKCYRNSPSTDESEIGRGREDMGAALSNHVLQMEMTQASKQHPRLLEYISSASGQSNPQQLQLSSMIYNCERIFLNQYDGNKRQALMGNSEFQNLDAHCLSGTLVPWTTRG